MFENHEYRCVQITDICILTLSTQFTLRISWNDLSRFLKTFHELG